MSADGEDNGRPSYVAEVTMLLQFLAGAHEVTEADAPAQRRGAGVGDAPTRFPARWPLFQA